MRTVNYSKVPWGIWLVEKLGFCQLKPLLSYKALIFILTYASFATYHLSRKPFSVVKISLCPLCADCSEASIYGENDTINANITPGWYPFNNINTGDTLMGSVDYAWLFSYAVGLYFSGFIADRLNLRYFLTVGMLGSGVSVCLMGVAFFAQIHKLYYFIIIQIISGIFQSTGWPAVLAVMSHWFGKQHRGLIIGIWNSNPSVGNILGTVIPSIWATCSAFCPWGWSFMVPGFIMLFLGATVYLFLVVDPSHVDLPRPIQHLERERQLQVLPAHKEGEDEDTPFLNEEERPKAINFFRALLIPGVVEYSLALFFNKLVSYTFLFWLPLYVQLTHPELSSFESDLMSTAFDFGGIGGIIIAGFVSDIKSSRATTCVIMLLSSIPTLFILRSVDVNLGAFVIFLFINGALINGPYGLIGAAVSSDLGTHPSLKANTRARATVAAIIDGTGSLGAAFGPLLAGIITDYWSWDGLFYILMITCFIAAALLIRLMVGEVKALYYILQDWHKRHYHPESAELDRLQHMSEEEHSTSNEDEQEL